MAKTVGVVAVVGQPSVEGIADLLAISDREADEMLQFAQRLRRHVVEWMGREHSELLAGRR